MIRLFERLSAWANALSASLRPRRPVTRTEIEEAEAWEHQQDKNW